MSNGGNMHHKQLSKIRIPLEDMPKNEELDTHGRILSCSSKEPCFTCGRHKRLRFNQRIDGKLFRIDECLYCTVRVKTFSNRQVK